MTRTLPWREAFDPVALHDRLDARRRALGITWRELSRQAGVHTTAIGWHLRSGRAPSAGTLAQLLIWYGDLDIGPYVPGAGGRPGTGR